MATPHILVAGHEHATVHSVNAFLALNSYQAETLPMGPSVVERISHEPVPNLIMLEVRNSREDLQILQQFRKMRPDLKIVVLCQHGDKRQVMEAIQIGARDCLTLPFREEDLRKILYRHANSSSQREIEEDIAEQVSENHFFIARSSVMKKIRVQTEILANIDVPVLILGENGTGKEVVAHLIHKLSNRNKYRLLKVNCAALLSDLLESELFGHEQGAFSGAIRSKAGQFELCDKGTFLLDEIAEMSASLQAKLLHVLQDKQFIRLGGETTIEVDVRIVAATNVDIQRAISERKFREDLYYLLSTFTICLPPLRDRREDIPLLLRHFLQRTASQYSLPAPLISPRLLDACLNYLWPGNVRELQTFVKRYLVMADESSALRELQPRLRRAKPTRSLPTVPPVVAGHDRDAHDRDAHDLKFLVRNLKDEAEIQSITKALGETNWNRKKAARLLSISYRGLLYKIREHRITRIPLAKIEAPRVENNAPRSGYVAEATAVAIAGASPQSSTKTRTRVKSNASPLF
jgi:two-component system response regulator AtoC